MFIILTFDCTGYCMYHRASRVVWLGQRSRGTDAGRQLPMISLERQSGADGRFRRNKHLELHKYTHVICFWDARGFDVTST